MTIETIQCSSRGFTWTLPARDVLTKPFLVDGEDHEPHLTAFIREYLHEGDTALDIGACFGFHTLEMSRQVGECGKVYAFEPQHEMYDLLVANSTANHCDNITAYHLALGDQAMPVCMYNAYEGDTNYGDSFISWKYKDMDAYTDSRQSEHIGKAGKMLTLNKKTTHCDTLDSFTFNRHVKFVKIDVQGFERMVLIGGVKFFQKHRPVMVIEFEDTCMMFHNYTTKELIEHLRGMDYTVLLLDHSYPCDHVCVPNETMHSFRLQFGDRIHPHTTNNPINNNVVHGVTKKLVL